MPWYDPVLAPACAAAACGEPVDNSTQLSLSMLGQGVDNAAASPCEETAAAVVDAQPQVSPVCKICFAHTCLVIVWSSGYVT